MPNVVTVEIKGLREVQDKMHALAVDIQDKVARQAVSAGARVIKDQAVLNASGVPPGPNVRTGLLMESIAARRMSKASSPGLENWAVGVFKGQTAKTHSTKGIVSKKKTKTTAYDAKGAAYYWKFVEFGTVRMSAKPFLRPAFNKRANDAAKAIILKLIDRIEKAGNP